MVAPSHKGGRGLTKPEIKLLKELEGWTRSISVPSIWSWKKGGYTTFVSPDGKRLAQADMTDREVILIFNRETRKIEYMNPTTEIGMKRVGLTKEIMEDLMGREAEG